MIFVSTGSRKFQFDRLIKKLDELVEAGVIEEEVFAQIAETAYEPKHYAFERYLSADTFKEYQQKSDIIITHAGTGALIGALKLGKQVIAVPRLSKFGEHSDDHQLQVAEALEGEGYVRVVYDMDDLADVYRLSKEKPIVKKYDKPSNIVPLIEKQIDEWFSIG